MANKFEFFGYTTFLRKSVTNSIFNAILSKKSIEKQLYRNM